MTFVGQIRYHGHSAFLRTQSYERALRPVEHSLPAVLVPQGASWC